MKERMALARYQAPNKIPNEPSSNSRNGTYIQFPDKGTIPFINPK